MRSCWAPLRVEKLRSNVPGLRSSPDAAMKNSANSSEISRGSAAKIARIAAVETSRNGLPPVVLRRIHDSSVWASHSAARAARHGASTGTCSDIESSAGTASSRSASTARSGGAWPVNPVSAYVDRLPPAT